ncbi:MAG: hypothetical protein ACLTW9_30715 [Enterocloster sp.]
MDLRCHIHNAGEGVTFSFKSVFCGGDRNRKTVCMLQEQMLDEHAGGRAAQEG